jgi:trans-aconitate methyltransferase
MKKRIEVLHKIIAQKQKGTKDKRMYSYLNTKKYGYEKINNYFCGENVLELGTDGSSTSSILVRWSKKLTIVDINDKFTPQVQKDKKLKDANFVLCDWADYKPNEKFSDIFLTDSLEHVKEPVKLLKLIKNWLREDGRLHVVVPNALSIHRLVGVEMGFLNSPYELNDNDISSNHIKVYDHNILKQEIKEAGLNIIVCEGVQFKPNTDVQLANLDEKFSKALNNLSYMFNEYCAEIYACCRL